MDRRILPHASFYFVKNGNVKKGGLSVAAKCSLFTSGHYTAMSAGGVSHPKDIVMLMLDCSISR